MYEKCVIEVFTSELNGCVTQPGLWLRCFQAVITRACLLS